MKPYCLGDLWGRKPFASLNKKLEDGKSAKEDSR